MPTISIVCGALDGPQKAELIQRLTAVAAEVTQIPTEFFTVTIQELPDENFGIGGRNIGEIKAEYATRSQGLC